MVLKWITNVFDNLKKPLSSYDTKKIEKKLDKGKDVSVDHLTSKRFFGKDKDGSYLGKDSTVASLDEYSGETEVSVPSTAVEAVKYDPETEVCDVKYRKGRKWYRFERMKPQDFLSFMAATSKGRFLNNIMRVKFRAKGY